MGLFTKESSKQKLDRLRREAKRTAKKVHRATGPKSVQRSSGKRKKPSGWFFLRVRASG